MLLVNSVGTLLEPVLFSLSKSYRLLTFETVPSEEEKKADYTCRKFNTA